MRMQQTTKLPGAHDPKPAILHSDSWAGRAQQDIVVIGETAQRYRIAAPPGAEVRLAGRDGRVLFGLGYCLVPKTAVTFKGV